MFVIVDALFTMPGYPKAPPDVELEPQSTALRVKAPGVVGVP